MKKGTIERLNHMLAADHRDIGEKTREAAIREFTRIANAYFALEDGLSLSCERKGKGYEVTIAFRASRVKNIQSID